MTDDYKTHPAYGVVAFNRVQGSPGPMFGSSLPQHGTFIRLVIRQAQRKHDLGEDWIMGKGRSLIEVWLSAAQFSELLTTMNIGDGVPCTIKRFDGAEVPNMPDDEQTIAERVYEAAQVKMDLFAEETRAELAQARAALLAKGSISVKARNEIVSTLDKILREADANLPYAVRSFQRAVEKTSAQAKAELDALVSHTITVKGLEALGVEIKAIGPGEDSDGD